MLGQYDRTAVFVKHFACVLGNVNFKRIYCTQILEDIYCKTVLSMRNWTGKNPTSIDIWVLADMKCWLGGAKERRQINDCQGKRAPGWAHQDCAYSRHGNRRTPKAWMANRWCTFEWDITWEIDMILTFIVIWGWFNRTLVCSAEGQEQNNRPCSISLHL